MAYQHHQRGLSNLTLSFLALFLILFIFWLTSIPTKVITSSLQSQIQRINDSQSIQDGSSNNKPIKKSFNTSKYNIISTDHDDDNSGATPVIGTHSLIRSSSSASSRNIEMVYALPPHSATTKKQPPPIALLLHGCTHSSVKFFSPSPDKCPSCLGLSEELAMSRALLQRGYVIVAVTSVDRQSGCWGGQRDVDNIRIVLNEMRGIVISNETTTMGETTVIDKGGEENDEDEEEEEEEEAMVVVAVGASSGGRFAGLLAAEGVVDAAVVMVMALGDKIRSRLMTKLVEKGDGLSSSSSSSSSLPPPIYLAPMPRDKRTTYAARKDWEIMTTTATEKYPVVLDETACLTLPVTHHYLHGRVPNLDSQDAILIVEALTKAGHIDSQTFLLKKDPKKSDWEGLLQRECGGGDSNGEIYDGSNGSGCLKNQVLEAGKSPLAEALFRAWAYHEYCSDVVPMALDYIESELEMNVS